MLNERTSETVIIIIVTSIYSGFVVSFIPSNLIFIPALWVGQIIFLFYIWGRRGSEKLSDFSKVPQPNLNCGVVCCCHIPRLSPCPWMSHTVALTTRSLVAVSLWRICPFHDSFCQRIFLWRPFSLSQLSSSSLYSFISLFLLLLLSPQFLAQSLRVCIS